MGKIAAEFSVVSKHSIHELCFAHNFVIAVSDIWSLLQCAVRSPCRCVHRDMFGLSAVFAMHADVYLHVFWHDFDCRLNRGIRD